MSRIRFALALSDLPHPYLRGAASPAQKRIIGHAELQPPGFATALAGLHQGRTQPSQSEDEPEPPHFAVGRRRRSTEAGAKRAAVAIRTSGKRIPMPRSAGYFEARRFADPPSRRGSPTRVHPCRPRGGAVWATIVATASPAAPCALQGSQRRRGELSFLDRILRRSSGVGRRRPGGAGNRLEVLVGLGVAGRRHHPRRDDRGGNANARTSRTVVGFLIGLT